MIVRIGPDGQAVVDPGSTGPLSQHPMYLKEGIHLFTLSALGTQPVQVNWVLKSSGVDAESLVNNGVGQMAALDLRWINPSILTPDAPPSLSTVAGDGLGSNPSPSPSSSAEQPQATPSMASAPAASIPSPVPASLLVTLNSGLLGRPSAGDEHVAVVGPAVVGGSIALADSSLGLLPGIIYWSSGSVDDRAREQADQGSLAEASSSPVADSAGADASLSTETAGAGASSSSGDALAVMKADRIVELAARLGRWLSLGASEEEAAPDGGELAGPELLAGTDAEIGRGSADRLPEHSSDRIDQADLGIPTGLIVVSAAAYRLRQLAGRWWRRTRGQLRAPSRPQVSPHGAGSGPRSSRRSTFETTRARTSRRP
jgi:hypothetical protein